MLVLLVACLAVPPSHDCDGSVDDGARSSLTWFADADGDGYGDNEARVEACVTPEGYVDDRSDTLTAPDSGATQVAPSVRGVGQAPGTAAHVGRPSFSAEAYSCASGCLSREGSGSRM